MSSYEVQEERPVSAAARAAGVERDAVLRRLGTAHHTRVAAATVPPRAGRDGQDGRPGDARGDGVGDESAGPRRRTRRLGVQVSVGRGAVFPVGQMCVGLPTPAESDGSSGRATCTVIVTIGHGRVPRVFWGTMRARGRMPGYRARCPSCALILMGVWCIATGRATSQRLKTRVRAKRQIGSEMPCDIPRQKNAKGCVRGIFYLLTGAF